MVVLNVHVLAFETDGLCFSIHWNDQKYRYHFWYRDFMIVKNTIYKNASIHSPEFGESTSLDSDEYHETISEVMHTVFRGNMIAHAIEDYRIRLIPRQAFIKSKQEHIRDHALDLFAVLLALTEAFDTNVPSTIVQTVRSAKQALRKAAAVEGAT